MFIIIHLSYARIFGTFYYFHFSVNFDLLTFCNKFLPFKREVNYSIGFNFRFGVTRYFWKYKKKTLQILY